MQVALCYVLRCSCVKKQQSCLGLLFTFSFAPMAATMCSLLGASMGVPACSVKQHTAMACAQRYCSQAHLGRRCELLFCLFSLHVLFQFRGSTHAAAAAGSLPASWCAAALRWGPCFNVLTHATAMPQVLHPWQCTAGHPTRPSSRALIRSSQVLGTLGHAKQGL